MKIALISDIHSNLMALKLALNDIENEKIDKIFFLGDYITDGEHENEIISIVKNKSTYAILGNREKYLLRYAKDKENYNSYKAISCAYNNLNKDSMDFIKSLKESAIIKLNRKRVLMIHGDNYTRRNSNLEEMFDQIIYDYDFDLCLFGHTHKFVNKEYKGKLFINPGSIGVPCDTPKYKYCILEINDDINVTLKEFDTVDTFNQLVLEYKKSNFYKKNKIWCSLLFATIKNGIDYFKDFVELYYSRIDANMDTKLCNKIWNDTFVWYCKNKKIDLI